MGKYRIADIRFSLSYKYQEYLKTSLMQYKIDNKEEVNHKIIVKLVDKITIPKGNIVKKNSQYIIKTSDHVLTYYKKNNEATVLIEHDFAYKKVTLFLKKNGYSNMPNVEYIFLGIIFLEISMYLGYLPLHATAIKANEKAILFMAPSGTGKSTHRKYWQEAFKDILVINDDKPLIKLEENKLYCYGSPFSGEDKLNNNIKAQLGAIVLLEQGLDNRIEKFDPKKISLELIRNTLTPKTEDVWDRALITIGAIEKNTPVYKLYATNNNLAAITIYNYLFGGQNEN